MGALSTILNQNNISIDSSIGQGSNKIKTAGLHLVQIKEFRLINDEIPRLSVKFVSVKDKREIAQNLFLVSTASGTNTSSVQTATAEFMINVVSLALNKANIIFAGGANSIDELFVKSEPLDKPTGTKIETFTIPALMDKQIYIATHIQIGSIGKQVIEKQTLDPKYVFNINKLTKTEVANKIETPASFNEAHNEMLTKVNFERASLKTEPIFRERYNSICARLGVSSSKTTGATTQTGSANTANDLSTEY
jgi:hypothetical protein